MGAVEEFPSGLSEYPPDAVEVTVTFLLPVTDEQDRSSLDRLAAALNAWQATTSQCGWWQDKVARYVGGRLATALWYDRPPQWKRPKPKPKRKPKQ